jgi:hypothetical protein
MPDNDLAGDCWRVPPSRYLQSRPATFRIPLPVSRYLNMRDGCRIATDIYLPEGEGRDARLPTILIQTPYYRRFSVVTGAQGVEPSPNVARYRDMFVPRGYAVVIIDIRGSGASFGFRDSFRSPREREDACEVVDWIVAQPWSNGALGATGISYLGAASDFLASTGHPAVKAIAPLFAVWDTYLDNYYPGGVLLTNLADVYDKLMVGLDHDQRHILKHFAYYADPHYRGPQPVDEDDGSLCRAAVAEHSGNFRMPEFIGKLEYRNEPLADRPELSSATISPSTYASGTNPEMAIYSVSGWMDGAGYANGAISRYLTMPNRHKYLLLGPWDHGARINASPWRAGEAPEFDILAEILRFFDEHLVGLETGLKSEQPIHYFAMQEERWHAAETWPPIAEPTRYALAAHGALAEAETAHDDGQDRYDVDFDARTGTQTRYERIAAIDSRKYYTDWHGRDAAMLYYTSSPLAQDAEMTGHGEVALWLSTSTADFAVHAYISELAADGASRYVTEGLLRALHRKETPVPAHYQASWSFHSCERADAERMPIGTPQLLKFALLPVSWTFKAGSRIRISFAGADADHCARIPADGPVRLMFWRGADRASSVALPLRLVGT